MEADVEGLIGAGQHERAADRLNWRKYYRVPGGAVAALWTRTWIKVGAVPFQRDRDGQRRTEQLSAPRRPESLVFPVTVSLDESSMKIDNANIPLTPGITVTVEIRIDCRRVLDYLLSPLAKIGSEAPWEREKALVQPECVGLL